MQKAGEVIHRARKFRGIKREPFAKDIGVSPPTLDRLERDNPKVDLDAIDRAAQKLGLKLDRDSRKIEPPSWLPPALPRKTFRILRVPTDLYADLELLAKGKVVEYLRDHVRMVTIRVKDPQSAGRSKGAARVAARSR